MEEINLNGKVYILKSDVEAERIDTADLRNKAVLNKKRMGVMEVSNVMWVGRYEDEDVNEEVLTHPYFPNALKYYKNNGYISECITDFEQERITTKTGTLLSYEYYKKARTILRELSCDKKADNFEVWEVWDPEKKVFKGFYPVLFVSHNYCFMVAPRIETGTEQDKRYNEYKEAKNI
jgi:hypothetical protein